jgi:hypothetical protein
MSAGSLAQCEVGVLSVSRPPTDDAFGAAVAMAGSTAAIGEPSALFGVVHVLEYTAAGWVFQDQLTPPEPQSGDDFGLSVAMTHDTIIVGARRRDAPEYDQGAAYLFRWTPNGRLQVTAVLVASDGDSSDRFGRSVAISADVAVVGAVLDENGGTATAGSAYVFRRVDGIWVEEAKFFDPQGADLDTFGGSVAVGGDVVLVGAKGNDDAGPDAGAVFVYRWDGALWSFEAQLVPPGQPLVEWFGESVAISPDGTLACIGAPQRDSQNGAVYVFHEEGGRWVQQATLTAGQPAGPFPLRGSCLSINASADRVLVGAPLDFAQGFEAGAAHLFRHDASAGWTEVAKLVGSGIEGGDHFGCGLALWGDMALIAATRESAPGFVYAYAGMSGSDCDGNGEPDGCDIISGCLDDDDGDGIPDDCEAWGDVNGDGAVNVLDLIDVLLGWGPCAAPCPPGCIGDANGDCVVGVLDVVSVILGWE